jgi:hypothetical protein
VADIVLASVIVAEIVVAVIAIAICYKVAEIVGRPPVGWVLLTLAMVMILISRFFFLAEFLNTPTTVDMTTFVGQSLGLPAFVAFLVGVYYMFRDMKTQLTRRQNEILAAGAAEQQ